MPTINITEVREANWTMPPTALEIAGYIDVWRVRIQSASSFLDKLSPDELEKKDRFRNDKNRNEFAAGRGALRYLSGKYLNRSPLELVLSASEHGKPCWQLARNETIYFNVAHSGDDVLIAFGNNELGIDVEKINPAFDYSGILNRCFSSVESDWVLRSGDHLSSFYRLWTRKEAILKATGIGVHNDLHLVPAIEGQYPINETSIGSNTDWTVSSFAMAGDVMAAIAHTPDIEAINFYELKL